MQLKNYILTFVFFLVVVIIKGQFIWQTTLGTNGTDSPRDFIKTNDGNYLTLGYSLSTSPTKGLHIAKLDTACFDAWLYADQHVLDLAFTSGNVIQQF